MKLIFIEKDGVERFAGYSTVEYDSSDESETVIETSEDELDSKVPDSVEGGWRENRQQFKLDDSGSIVFDESYTPPDPTSGGA